MPYYTCDLLLADLTEPFTWNDGPRGPQLVQRSLLRGMRSQHTKVLESSSLLVGCPLEFNYSGSGASGYYQGPSGVDEDFGIFVWCCRL